MWADALHHPVRRNFLLNLLDGAVFGFGLSLVARTTVLPLMISRSGGGNVAIAMIPVLWIVGNNLPQVLAVRWTDRATSLHRFMLGTALIQRLPWLLMGVLLFFVEAIPVPVLSFVLLASIGVAALAGGVNLPAWFELVADLTPTRLRGRLFGLRATVAGALGIAGGWISIAVIGRWGWPQGFGLLFIGAFSSMMISYVFLAMLRDDHAHRPRFDRALSESLARIPVLLRRAPNYRAFLTADVLLVTSTMSAAFLTVTAFERFPLTDADVGRFTMVATGTSMIGAAVFGYLADHEGHRINMLVAAGMSAASCVIAVFAPSVAVFYVAFGAAALAEGLRTLSRLPLIAELCEESDRPTFVALGNLAVVPFALLGVLAGLLADAAGFSAVYILAAVAALSALVVLGRYVREPRINPGIVEVPS